MQKNIMIGERATNLMANAASPIHYRNFFKKDFFNTLQGIDTDKLDEAIESISEITFILNRQAEGVDICSLNYNDYVKWMEQFGPMDFVNHAADIIDFYMQNEITTSSAKKN